MNEPEKEESVPEVFAALARTMAFSARDWGASSDLAWLWGIACGWDDEALAECVAKHGWSPEGVERLRRLRRAVERATEPGK